MTGRNLNLRRVNRRGFLRFLAALAAIVTARAAQAHHSTEGLQDMTVWQPIASAPKDGTWVLLFVPNFKRPVQLGFYVDTVTVDYGKVKRERKYWNVERMFSFQQDDPQPSHWMPMPSNPAA